MFTVQQDAETPGLWVCAGFGVFRAKAVLACLELLCDLWYQVPFLVYLPLEPHLSQGEWGS